ncbi:MAG: DUF2336 domain-containing protein [Xanthobacteraceae bacterium]|jgi:uncharacterized protein (DUF2336 family)
MSLTPQALLAELDTTLPQVEESWRSTVLRKITDLFLSGADLYNDQHVALFDAVMSRLLPGLDRDDLAELGNRLAGIANAPLNVLASLARHLDILVCGPVLEQAKALPDKVLAEAADRDRVDPNILAKIAARPRLGESVTDVLLKRGGLLLQRKIIDNPDARISEGGFARVIMGLDGDKDLAQAVAARNDLPAELRLWLKDILGQ